MTKEGTNYTLTRAIDADGNTVDTAHPLPVVAAITGGNALPVKTQESPVISAAIAHRTNIATADKITSPTCVGALAAGSTTITLATTTLYGAIAARIAGIGSAGAGTISAAFTPTENKSVLMTIPQVAGATHYDVFLSVDAAPKWVARVTEAQRAAGCAVTAVGVVGAGGAAGKVDIQVLGTGVQTTTSEFANNNAYTPAIASAAPNQPVPCAGYKNARVYMTFNRGDCTGTPTCSVIPFTKTGATWGAGDVYTMDLATRTGVTMTVPKDFNVEGAESFAVLCNPAGGTFSAIVILS